MERDILNVDGKDYFLIVSIEGYYYFAGVENQNDFFVKKKEIVDNEEYFVSLDSIDELNKAMEIFSKHWRDNKK